MVHLNQVPTDKEINAPLAEGMSKISFHEQDHDTFTASVYGSKFAGQDLPKYEIPDDEMPREIAYRMIKYVKIAVGEVSSFAETHTNRKLRDDLTLDGTPTLNLASFVTTYMEEEAEKLMVESFSKNFIDYEEYPVSAGILSALVSSSFSRR
jgi:glutamate decarboxylase